MKFLREKLRVLKQIIKAFSRFLKKNQTEKQESDEQPATIDMPELEGEQSGQGSNTRSNS